MREDSHEGRRLSQVRPGGGRIGPPASEKRKDLGYIAELAEAAALLPVIDACYPLERIADAYRHVDAGHKRGNVVVTMTGEPQPGSRGPDRGV